MAESVRVEGMEAVQELSPRPTKAARLLSFIFLRPWRLAVGARPAKEGKERGRVLAADGQRRRSVGLLFVPHHKDVIDERERAASRPRVETEKNERFINGSAARAACGCC